MYVIFICLIILIIIRIVNWFCISKRKSECISNPTDKNLDKFIKILKYSEITNNPQSWAEYKSFFFYINDCDAISKQKKEELYSLLIQKGCYLGNVRINSGLKDKSEKIEKSEQIGEEQIEYNLKGLPEGYKIIKNVKLESKMGIQEFDEIVIGKNGIFHLEVRNEGGEYGFKLMIDEKGNWKKVDCYGEHAFLNPITKVYKNQRVLSEKLKEYSSSEEILDIVKGIVVLSNPKVFITGSKNSSLPVIRGDQIERYITEYNSNDIELSLQEVENIYNFLINKSISSTKNNKVNTLLRNNKIEKSRIGILGKAKSIISILCILVIISIMGMIIFRQTKNENNISTSNKTKNENNITMNNKIKDEENTTSTDNKTNNENITSIDNKTKEDECMADEINTEDNVNDYRGTAFDGKVIMTVNDYKINGQDIIVNINVVNNYNKEINLWSKGIYIMNENGKVFNIDNHTQLRAGSMDFTVVSGENRNFTFYLSRYEESSKLTFKIDQIWCMDSECMKNKIEISLK